MMLTNVMFMLGEYNVCDGTVEPVDIDKNLDNEGLWIINYVMMDGKSSYTSAPIVLYGKLREIVMSSAVSAKKIREVKKDDRIEIGMMAFRIKCRERHHE